MSNPSRKYVSEFCLNMHCCYHALIQQDALSNTDHLKLLATAPPFHIYVICSRPRIAIKANSIKIDKNSISGIFTIQRGMEFEELPFNSSSQRNMEGFCFKCEYPHTEFEITNPSGTRLRAGKIANLMALFFPNAALNLEVLYVGQSYGDNGSHIAIDRLQTHATLQSIYAEAMRLSPDKEIWMILLAFEQNLIVSFDSRKPVDTSMEVDTSHIETVLKTGVTEHQRINFTEAALIRYFQPPYNKMFKDKFPNPAHSTYSECYELDLNAVNVELNTEELRSQLWSQTVSPLWSHYATFELYSKTERKSLFDFNF